MSDEISKLKQQIFYEKVINKIFNIVKHDKVNKEKLEHRNVKLDCYLTDYYNTKFSEIKTACLVSESETFPSEILDVKPNELKESVKNGKLNINT